MAVYKVIQDVEAEDKLLGPLGFRQFIYAGITLTCLFIDFKLVTSVAIGDIRFALALFFLLPALLFGVLAAPLGGGQSTEVWLLARIRFFVKPQIKIWDQDGPKELVTVTAPKRETVQYSKNLTLREVKSRLEALAATLDSRGWALKNVDVNLYAQPGYMTNLGRVESDRLITPTDFPQEVSGDLSASNDILDEQNNSTASRLLAMVKEREDLRKQQLQDELNKAAGSALSPTAQPTESKYNPNNWFTAHPESKENPGNLPPAEVVGVAPKAEEMTEAEKQLVADLKKRAVPGSNKLKMATGHLKRIPTSAEKRKKAADEVSARLKLEAEKAKETERKRAIEAQELARAEAEAAMAAEAARQQQIEAEKAAKMKVANEMSSDVSVASMINQVNRKFPDTDSGDDEIVINLHER